MTSLPDHNADGKFGLRRDSDAIILENDLIVDSTPRAQPLSSNVASAGGSPPQPAPAPVQLQPAVSDPIKPVESDKIHKTKVNFWNKLAGSENKKDKKKEKKAKKEKKEKKESAKKERKSTRRGTNSNTIASPPVVPAESMDPQSPQETFPGIPMHVVAATRSSTTIAQPKGDHDASEQSNTRATPAAGGKPSVLLRAISIFSPNKNKITAAPASSAAAAATPAHVPSRAPPPRTPSMLSAAQLSHPPPAPPAGQQQTPAARIDSNENTRAAAGGPGYRESPSKPRPPRTVPTTAQQSRVFTEDVRDSASPMLHSDATHSGGVSAENSAPTAAALAAALDRASQDDRGSSSAPVDGGLQKLALELNQDVLNNSKQAVQRTSARRLWDMKSEMTKADGVTELQRFLSAKDLQSLIPLFAAKDITYSQLLQMNEEALKNLQVPMLQRRRLLFEIVEENNRNFLKSDSAAAPKTPHRTPRSSMQSRDFIRQADVVLPAGTAYVSGGHVSPRFRSASKTQTLADYEETIADLNKKKDEWKQRYMAQERRNRELEAYMHQHFEQFKQFLNQQESEYNRLLTRLRDEGLPASGQSSTAQPNSSGSAPVSGGRTGALSSSTAPLPAVEPAKEPVLEEGHVSNDERKDQNRNSFPKPTPTLLSASGSSGGASSPPAAVAAVANGNAATGSGFGSVTNASRATAADSRGAPITNVQQAAARQPGSNVTSTSATPAASSASGTPIAAAAAAAPPAANPDTAPRTRSTQNRNSLKRGSNSRAAFQRVATGAQQLQHLERVRAKCLFEYRAENQKELSFHAGDIVTILNQDQSGWWLAHHNGRSGFVPRNYLEVI